MSIRLLKRLAARLPPDPKLALVRQSIVARSTTGSTAQGPIVAIQCLEDPLYFGLFAAIVTELRERHDVRGELIPVHSISGAVGTGWKAAVTRSVLFRWPISMQWVRAYRPLVTRVAYRSVSLAHPLQDVVDAMKSLLTWRRLRSTAGDFELEIEGIPVGDLIVDSYLRFRPSPVFEKRDRFVLRLIWQAHRDVRRALHYFRSARPALYLTSYSTYLEHGIPVRAAVSCGTPVTSFGSIFVVGKELSRDDWFQTPNADHYRRTFESLSDQERRLEEAEAQLAKRFAGEIDAAMIYMRQSAYGEVTEHVPADLKGAAIVFMHDFYDSPHVYRDLVFQDFWSWICFTIDTLVHAGIPFYLKPHPNQIGLSGAALEKLRQRYPAARLLAARTNAQQLAAAGIACGVTVYGSVAHELAYLGVPAIACARHPHVSFDFCRTARSREEYASYLRSPGERPLDAKEMRRQALMFYYMHNLYGDPDVLALRAHFAALWMAFQDDTFGAGVVEALDRMRNSPAFRALTGRMIGKIEPDTALLSKVGT